MRLVESTLSPQGKGQYLLALGVRDIELMLGEAENAYRFFPKTPDRKEDRERLGGIVRGLQDALKAAHELEDDGKKIPLDKRYRFRDEYLKDVTRFEVIDHRNNTETPGRAFVAYNANLKASVQDAGRTLKVFVTSRPESERAKNTPNPFGEDWDKFIENFMNIFVK